MLMEIRILGSGQEVGRSAILIHNKILLDYGVMLQPEPPKYPEVVSPDVIILSHAHLDHSGALPILYKRKEPPLFTNDVTIELTNMLIKDSLKVARREHFKIPFTEQNRKKMLRSMISVNYNRWFSIPEFKVQFYDAGHIPGSCSILLKHKTTGKVIFYSGDIKLDDTRLLRGCSLPEKTDVLIIESTYGQKEHENRETEEKRFLETIEGIVSNDEKALIPVFAVGRAQEVMLILEHYAHKIALDGMARTATEIIEFYKRNVKDSEKLKKIMRHVFWIKTKKDREIALKHYPIIISSAGMLGGGPIVAYLKELADNTWAHVLFTGYLVEDTPGYELFMSKRFVNKRESFKVKCKIDKYDFSAHAGRSELFKIIEKTNPELIICVHGEHTKRFAKEIEKKYGIPAIGPKNGQDIGVC